MTDYSELVEECMTQLKEHFPNPVYPTGSRIIEGGYTEESDWDCFTRWEHNEIPFSLLSYLGFACSSRYYNPSHTIGFYKILPDGNVVNLVLCRSDLEFDIWTLATCMLTLVQPKTREERIEVFSKVRERKTKTNE